MTQASPFPPPSPSDFLDNPSHSLTQHQLANAFLQGPPFFNVIGAPYNADPTGVLESSTAINAALADASAAGATGIVVVPGGKYRITQTIIGPSGVLLMGAGSHNVSARPGTNLVADPGLVGPIFESDPAGFWHHAGLFRLRTSEGAGHGIVINEMGENSVIDQVASYSNAGHGILIDGGGTPQHIGRVSLHSNAGSGIRFANNDAAGHTQVLYVAGDNNGDALIYVDGGGTRASIQVLGWKAERSASGTPGHDDVIRVHNGGGGFYHFGQGRVQIGVVAAPSGAIIRQTADVGNNVGRVSVWGVARNENGTDYVNGYQDDFNTISIPTADFIRTPWFGLGAPGSPALSGFGRYIRVSGLGYVDIDETTAPAAPAANTGRLFVRDTGAGKTELCMRFATGTIQVIATEP